MNEQELIIQGNQASVLMPELRRYVDEQIAALSAGAASKAYVNDQIAKLGGRVTSYVDGRIEILDARDNLTLFISFDDDPSDTRTPLLYLDPDSGGSMSVYPNAYPSSRNEKPSGIKASIATGICMEYSTNYPWLVDVTSIYKMIVDGYIALEPVNSELAADAGWLRLGYKNSIGGADAVEQHFGNLISALGGSGEELFATGFITDDTITLTAPLSTAVGITFCLKGWMLLKFI